jgi:hypothetical protein
VKSDGSIDIAERGAIRRSRVNVERRRLRVPKIFDDGRIDIRPEPASEGANSREHRPIRFGIVADRGARRIVDQGDRPDRTISRPAQ